jgi:endo-1,4-beta-xylanase
MKKNVFISILTILAIIVAVFSGCDSDVDPGKSVKSTKAELKSLSVGNINADIPTAITGATWDDTAQTLSGLAAEYTKTIEFPPDAVMISLTITANVSDNAKVEFATSTNANTRPGLNSFKTTDNTASLSPPRYLYIRVTAEDDSYRNYYRFHITQVIANVPVTGITLEKSDVTLTIHSSEKLNFTISPPNATDKTVTWTSSDPAVASVDEDGTVTTLSFTTGGTTRFSNGGTSTAPNIYPATGTATITATTADGEFLDTITVTATTAAQVGIMDLPPLKDKFANYFMIGNIARSSGDITGSGTSAAISQARLTRHYNILTSENNMKPQNMTNARNATTGVITYTWTNADNFVNAAESAGLKVVGHALLWHSQNPNWVWSDIASRTGTAVASKETALTIMRQYITAVASRYAGRIHSWDVLNEAFPDNAGNSANWKDAIRRNASGEGQDANPWYVAIGSDFVYEGFKAARLADPGAILYYNDYNTDVVNRARLIRDMVHEVNQQWLSDPDYDNRLLIEGIGMQEHHNNGITAARITATINTFRPLGVRLSVSELDIIAVPSYNDLGGSGASQNHNATNVTNNTLITQARLYGEYMRVYLDNADIIERVSLWGVTDDTSWRSRGLPLLFDHAAKAKPAYYRFVNALDEFEASQQ